MSSKLRAKSLPHIPGYTAWENANGSGRPGYRPGHGNQYADVFDGLASLDEGLARVVACFVLFGFGAVFGGLAGHDVLGGPGAVTGIFLGAACGVAIGYYLGLFLVRLTAFLMIAVPVGVVVYMAGIVLHLIWIS
jgi:hypothetical protein